LERNSVIFIFEEGQVFIALVIYMIMGWLGRTKEKNNFPIKLKKKIMILNGRLAGWFDGAAQRGGQICGAGGGGY
jgi:hypothetical protein